MDTETFRSYQAAIKTGQTEDVRSTNPQAGAGYRFLLASIRFTRPSTHRRTNSDKDRSIPFAQRLARASSEADTFVVSILVGFLAIHSK